MRVNRSLLAPSNTYSGKVMFTPDSGPVETVTVSVSTFPLVTNGVGYLRKMLDTVLFPEIWRLRTDL